MRRCSASTKRPPSRLWIGSIRSCRCRRGEWSATALSTTATAPFRCTPRLTPAMARWWAKPPRATPARSLFAFLAEVVANQPRGKEIPLLADNLSTNKTKRVEQFLAAHLKLYLHYTPTYSSWLNQVENWFTKIERDVIAAASSSGSKTWPADFNARFVTTIALPSSSSGPTATPHIASVLVPFHLLQATTFFISTRCWTR
jgi:transposase